MIDCAQAPRDEPLFDVHEPALVFRISCRRSMPLRPDQISFFNARDLSASILAHTDRPVLAIWALGAHGR